MRNHLVAVRYNFEWRPAERLPGTGFINGQSMILCAPFSTNVLVNATILFR